jgi:malic enzyme
MLTHTKQELDMQAVATVITEQMVQDATNEAAMAARTALKLSSVTPVMPKASSWALLRALVTPVAAAAITAETASQDGARASAWSAACWRW